MWSWSDLPASVSLFWRVVAQERPYCRLYSHAGADAALERGVEEETNSVAGVT